VEGRADDGAGCVILRAVTTAAASPSGDELQRARAEITRLRELLALAQDFGRVGVWERDPDTLVGRWDEHVFRFFGFEPGETPSLEAAAARVHPDDSSLDSVRESMSVPGDHMRRFRVLRPDGTVAHLRSHWRVLADPQGRATRVVGVMVDDSATHAVAGRAQAEHAQLELALALSGIGLWRYDVRSGLIHHDERSLAMVGRPPNPGGLRLAEVRAWVHPDDIGDLRQALDTTLQRGGTVDTQTRYRHVDGSWRTVLTRRMLLRDADGRPATVLGVALDVTDQQHRTTEALQLARRLELAAQAARVGLWSGSLQDELPEWNPYMYVLLARDPVRGPLTIGQALRDYALEDDRDRVATMALDWAHGRNGDQLEFEMRVRRDDGQLRWLQIRAYRELDADGSARAHGIVLDVTEQRDVLQRLREANERTLLALTAADMGTWSHDEVNGRDDWDAQMFRLRGLPPGPQAPDRQQRLALVLPEDRPQADSSSMPLVTGAQPQAYEFRIRRADDGQVRTLASRSIALADSTGRVLRRIGVNWDVTEVRSLERMQRERELALRESRSKSALFARISHELRTPLNAVLGLTQLLRSEDADATPSQRRQRLLQIEQAGRALLRVVDEALDLSQRAESQREMLRVALPLAAAVDQALSPLAAALTARRLQLERGELDAVVMADAACLQQVLSQLLGNAVKFSRPGGAVRLNSRVVGREAVLVIEDSGPGIDRERARRLFEPFEPLGAATPSEPMGVGLAIGQALAQRMGGRIELASSGAQGSLFELWLPLADAAPAPLMKPGDGTPSLLYIEDNDVNMLIVRELLRQRPRVVFHGAPDGASGVRLARERRPSLILIDMQLPDMDGIEVLRRLRADAATASIPCVALSANAMPEDMAAARAAGFDDYWTKPIDLAAFLSAVDGLIAGGPATAR
jgi:signal transduction histidine kinase/ActR/RegA family two-component response regulator